MYKYKYLTLVLMVLIGLRSFYAIGQKIATPQNPQFWLTDPNSDVQFKLQDQSLKPAITLNGTPTISIDKSKVYQQMDGFGYALTGGSAMLINKMSAEKQGELLK